MKKFDELPKLTEYQEHILVKQIYEAMCREQSGADTYQEICNIFDSVSWPVDVEEEDDED